MSMTLSFPFTALVNNNEKKQRNDKPHRDGNVLVRATMIKYTTLNIVTLCVYVQVESNNAPVHVFFFSLCVCLSVSLGRLCIIYVYITIQ